LRSPEHKHESRKAPKESLAANRYGRLTMKTAMSWYHLGFRVDCSCLGSCCAHRAGDSSAIISYAACASAWTVAERSLPEITRASESCGRR